MSNDVPVIAIDGLAASGKGTVAKAVASRLAWNLLDSGLLYRITAFLADEFDLDMEDRSGIADLISKRVCIDYSSSGIEARSNSEREQLSRSVVVLSDSLQGKSVYWNGQDVTAIVRGDKVTRNAALVAASQRIRNELVPKQREQRVNPGLVADGRDMGTVIFPDAPLKVFLDASDEVRARRRMEQMGMEDTAKNFHDVLKNLKDRDNRDSLRKVAPAVAAKDAVTLDSSELTAQETVDRVLKLARARGLTTKYSNPGQD